MREGRKYEALVSAKTEAEAIDVASEALPEGAVVVRAQAIDVSATEGPDSFQVTLWFKGDRGGHAPD